MVEWIKSLQTKVTLIRIQPSTWGKAPWKKYQTVDQKSSKAVILNIYWITEIMDLLPRKKCILKNRAPCNTSRDFKMVKEKRTYATTSFPGFFQALQRTWPVLSAELSKSNRQTKNTVPFRNQCPPHIPIVMTQETVQCQNKVLLLPRTAPIQFNILQSRSEKEQSSKALDSSSTFQMQP